MSHSPRITPTSPALPPAGVLTPKRFVEEAVQRLELGPQSRVVELASNDGYLLQYVQQRGIPCLGIEPTHATARGGAIQGNRHD